MACRMCDSQTRILRWYTSSENHSPETKRTSQRAYINSSHNIDPPRYSILPMSAVHKYIRQALAGRFAPAPTFSLCSLTEMAKPRWFARGNRICVTRIPIKERDQREVVFVLFYRYCRTRWAPCTDARLAKQHHTQVKCSILPFLFYAFFVFTMKNVLQY